MSVSVNRNDHKGSSIDLPVDTRDREETSTTFAEPYSSMCVVLFKLPNRIAVLDRHSL